MTSGFFIILSFWQQNNLKVTNDHFSVQGGWPFDPFEAQMKCHMLWSVKYHTQINRYNLSFSYTYTLINSLKKNTSLSYPVMSFLNVFYWDSSLHYRPVTLRLLTKDLIFQVNY